MMPVSMSFNQYRRNEADPGGLFRVEGVDMRAGMDPELLMLGGGEHESFGAAAQVHGESAPVARGIQWHRDPIPPGAAHAPVLGIEIVAHVVPQQVVVEGVGIVAARLAQQVARCFHGEQGAQEAQCKDAPMVSLVAVLIGPRLPGDDRLERRGLEAGYTPLRAGEV